MCCANLNNPRRNKVNSSVYRNLKRWNYSAESLKELVGPWRSTRVDGCHRSPAGPCGQTTGPHLQGSGVPFGWRQLKSDTSWMTRKPPVGSVCWPTDRDHWSPCCRTWKVRIKTLKESASKNYFGMCSMMVTLMRAGNLWAPSLQDIYKEEKKKYMYHRVQWKMAQPISV